MTLRRGAASIAIVAALWLVTAALWLTPGITRPDGAGYFVYLPSTYFDHDLLFFDEWAKVGLIRNGDIAFKDVTPTRHLSNHWTVGSALAWYPPFAAADGTAFLTGAPRTGFSPLYVAAAAFTSALAGLFVLLAGLHVARERFGAGAATIAAMAIWLGSPAAWYALRHATMSHAISAAACAAVVLLSLRLRDVMLPSTVFATGLAIGFACTVRPQNITMAIVPLLIAPRVWKRVHLLVAGSVVAALPQLIVSQTLWGAPFAFVNIGGQAHPWQMFRTFRPFETIFSWYHGLATWTPLLVVAIAGFIPLRKADRGLGDAAIVTFAAQWLLLSTLERWFWGGASFGQRRFDSCTIFFILGLAAVLKQIPRWAGALAVIAGSAWTMALFITSAHLNLNRYQSPRELLAAFRTAVHDPAWHTWLGYTPPSMRPQTAVAAIVTTAVVALLVIVVRKNATSVAAAYLVGMSLLFAWCGFHPKYDAFSNALIARHGPSGAAADTARLLTYEADYMARTGRPRAASEALREAARITR